MAKQLKDKYSVDFEQLTLSQVTDPERTLSNDLTLETYLQNIEKSFASESEEDIISKFDNLKYEPKDKGSSSARLGKATGEYVDDLVEFYGIRNWKRRHQDYPKNQEEFDEEQQKNYLDKIKFLQRKGVDIGRVTPEEAIINIC